ncbi:D-glycero-beta-D-manno-heptose-7-phosphate kinase [Tropicimonas sp. IMCC34011]|uniref:D-glycero-beta-D-manno-heptose-7-phosphate kinase n=1 Tax=Tropicimonas sp. IMCC34011 TaxID=2248759 RepID=UPI000E26B268|nr:D-glycero-beta-D-manno-heptose-7-phosphate kinase [Tropicimonas sp. IMCC34011]
MTSLAPWIAAFAGQRIVCVGDVMLDTFTEGHVGRISPERPIPVFEAGRERSVPGGAANVARGVAALGGACDLVSVIGTDEAGVVLGALLDGAPGIEADLIRSPDRCTSHKTRFVAFGQHMLRVDREMPRPLSPSEETAVVEAARQRIPGAGALILSDYAKGVLTGRVIADLVAAGRKEGVPVAVDPKAQGFERYAGADVLTPNLPELERAFGAPLGDEAALSAAAVELAARAGVGALLVTRGSDGMTLARPGQAPRHIRAEAREVFDVVGAGDTVIGTLALALAAGVALADAARIANAAAAIVVGKRGTSTVSPEELADRLEAAEQDGKRLGAPHLLTLEEAVRYVARRRAEGRRIGFTNGVFDIVHPGHIALLEFTRSTCDVLIVGLNGDVSVRRLGKGPGRPVNPELDRAAVLGAFGTVDAVVIFDEDTPVRLIRSLKPDVLVKGADYSMDAVVGSDIVLGYGGEVRLAPLVDGKSSTSIIRRAREGAA